MIVYKRVFRWKLHAIWTRGKVRVEFVGWFLLGFVPLILWQVSDEDRR